MCRKKTVTKITVVPTDQSPEGVEELAYIINALLFESLPHKEVNNDEEYMQVLREYLARPKEERDRECKEIVDAARKRFREMKARERRVPVKPALRRRFRDRVKEYCRQWSERQ